VRSNDASNDENHDSSNPSMKRSFTIRGPANLNGNFSTPEVSPCLPDFDDAGKVVEVR
jgi:hypothetical protein